MSRQRILWFRKYRILMGFLSISPLIWLLAMLAYEMTIGYVMICQHHKELIAELNQVNAMPGAVFIENDSYCGAGKASARRIYLIPRIREEVFEFYDQELRRLGWQPPVPGTMPDTYDPTLRFCKGNFTASVSFDSHGKTSNTSLSFQAGVISECETIPYIPFAYLWFFFGGAISWLVYAVIMQNFIWRKEAVVYIKILESVLNWKPRPVEVGEYQITTPVILIASVIGIVMIGYKIILYLTNFYF